MKNNCSEIKHSLQEFVLNESTTDQKIVRKTVNLIFIVIVFMNFFGNIDHGTLPAGSIAIRTELGLDNFQYGLLESIVFLGVTVGKLYPLSYSF